jgi:radical SAM superfamily enzyme YgiQ (UPF0313 family)
MILLLTMPFWTPLIPPLGIACIKSYLQRYGYEVLTIDTNVEAVFQEIYHGYFRQLMAFIPEKHRGNFYNVGHDILRNHMMAHIHNGDEKKYTRLVKHLVCCNYFCQLDNNQVLRLIELIDEFYRRLKTYICDLLDSRKPSVLGLSANSGSLPASLFTFKVAKERYPDIKTVMGGGVFTGQLAPSSPNLKCFIEKTPYLEKIIIGEGEKLFLKLLQGKLPPGRKVYTLKDIDDELVDLNSIELPDFSDFDLSRYPYLPAYGSRSCLFQCKFCAETVNWGKYRKKKQNQLVNELRELNQRYGAPMFLMSDSLLNPIITDLARGLINSGSSLYWEGYLRADPPVCNVDNSLLWRQGGFYRASLGIETGSMRLLELMGKRISPRQIKQAVSSLANAGIKTTSYWMVGYPGETEKDFLQTLKLIEEIGEDIYEAECNTFNYYLTGQVNSGNWQQNSKLLYPEWATDMLVTQTWILDCEPGREETYKRLSRFVEHCKRLGIPNPYSMVEIHQADKRWKIMQKNAVPSLLEVNTREKTREERKKPVKINMAQQVEFDEGDFTF